MKETFEWFKTQRDRTLRARIVVDPASQAVIDQPFRCRVKQMRVAEKTTKINWIRRE